MKTSVRATLISMVSLAPGLASIAFSSIGCFSASQMKSKLERLPKSTSRALCGMSGPRIAAALLANANFFAVVEQKPP